MNELKFFVLTDTHYFDSTIGAYGEEYERFMDFEQKCFAETEAINKAVFKLLEDSREADIVLIAGDLSFNGEKKSHVAFSKLLHDFKEKSGKKIFVVTAGHDIEKNPFGYNETGRIATENITFDELYDFYRDFGYDDAIEFNRKHLSYVANLSEDVRLIVICNDTENAKNQAYDDDFLDWIKAQAQNAQKENKIMVAMEHYPVLAGQPALVLIPDARQKDSKKLIEALADNGVHLIFTGHMHNQSINVTQTAKGNKFYDVCTGSLIGCPAYYRLVTIKDENTVEIESRAIPDFEWDTNGKTCKQYLQDQFERMIRTFLISMRDDPARFLGKFGAGDKKKLYKPVQFIGKKLNSWTVGKVARLFLVKAEKEIKDRKFTELLIDIVRNLFEGNQPFKEGTPEGDTILRVFKRLKPVFKILNKKLHGAQGEEIDLFEILKHSAGNYGIDDHNAIIYFDIFQ